MKISPMWLWGANGMKDKKGEITVVEKVKLQYEGKHFEKG